MSTSASPPCYVVHTDGSCFPNPGPGGYAAIIEAPDGSLRELSGSDPVSTNNRSELLAVIVALESIPRDSIVRVFTDSTYVTNKAKPCLLGGVRPSKPNPDLWRRFREAALAHYSVQCVWVRGHAGNTRNERCDHLAGEARRSVRADPTRALAAHSSQGTTQSVAAPRPLISHAYADANVPAWHESLGEARDFTPEEIAAGIVCKPLAAPVQP